MLFLHFTTHFAQVQDPFLKLLLPIFKSLVFSPPSSLGKKGKRTKKNVKKAKIRSCF